MPKISDLPADVSPDPADLVPFVDVTASRTESVTVANLAASSAFSGQYAPLTAGYQSQITKTGYWSVPPGLVQSLALTLNRLYAMPILNVGPSSISVDRIAIEVTSPTASSTVRLGIGKQQPDSLTLDVVVDAGVVDSSTLGVKELTIAETLEPGVYWLLAAAQGVTCSVNCSGNTLARDCMMASTSTAALGTGISSLILDGVSGAFGSTVTLSGNNNTSPRVSVRFA